jgi:prepilin-type N-terminal cleavage/methylation domain-containing protein
MNTRKEIGQKKKRGFSLVEIAITLAVVAGVIGGIWAAMASFYEDYKVNKTIEGNTTIVKNTQSLFSFSTAKQTGYELNPILIAAGLIPKDWVRNATTIVHPFGGGFQVANLGAGGFNINIYGLKRSVCVKLVVKESSIITATRAGRPVPENGYNDNAGVGYLIRVNYPNASFWTFPVTVAQAKAACSSNSHTVSFFYGYNRMNN